VVGTHRTPISCVCLLLSVVSVSGAQPNGPDLPDNARYLLPAAEAWTTALPAPAAAEASLDAHHVYVPLTDGRVIALARESGVSAWLEDVGAVGRPLPAGPSLVVPTADGLAALDVRTGAVLWRTAVEGAPLAGLIVVNGGVAGMAPDGRVAVVELETGDTRWSRDHGYSPSARALAAAGDHVYAAYADRVVGIHVVDGSVAWVRALPGPLGAPVVGERRLMVGSADNTLFALDPRSGALLWRWRTGGTVVGSAGGPDQVYFTALDNRLRAVASGNGNQRWQRPLATRPAQPPQLVGGVVVVTGVAPEVSAFDARTGAVLGRYTAPAELRGPVLIDPAPGPYAVSLAVVTRTNLVVGLRPTGLALAEPALAPLTALPGRTLPMN
jgi:outer membrane protein assembly factor BamB